MDITIEKTITVEEKVDTNKLKVMMGGQKDIDSTNLEVYYDDVEIASGHLNNKTNFAHITMNEDNQDLEDYLLDAIENRTIVIQ